MTNKFKELDLIDKVTEELWAEVSDQDHPQEKEMVWGRPYKQLRKEEEQKEREKRKDTSIWIEGSKE